MTKKKNTAAATPSKSPRGEEDPSGSPATSSQATSIVTLPYACPLCVSLHVSDPVVLHKDRTSNEEEDSVACIGCRRCAAEWRGSALPLNGDNKVANAPCVLCRATISLDQEFAPVDMNHLRSTTNPGNVSTGYMIRNPCTALGEAATTGLDAPSPSSVLCGVCEDAKGGVECSNCGFPLCDDCVKTTHSKGKFKDHTLIPIGTHRKAPNPAAARTCCHHPEEPLKLFCNTCNEPVCVACCFGGAHTGHKADQMQTVADQAIQQLIVKLQQIEESVKVVGGSASIAEAIPMIETQRGVLQQQISEHFASQRRVLDAREVEITKQLSEFLDSKATILQSRAVLLDRTQSEVARFRASVEESRALADHVDLMLVASLAQPRIVSLSAQLDSVRCGDDGTTVQDLVAPIKEIKFVVTKDRSQFEHDVTNHSALHFPGAAAASPLEQRQLRKSSDHRANVESPNGAAAPPAPRVQTNNNYNWKLPSLNIATQVPNDSAPPASRNTTLPNAISKRKQFLSLAEEAEAGEPQRKSTSRTTNATLGGITSHFQPRIASKTDKGDAAGDADSAPIRPPIKPRFGQFELKL